MGAVVDPDRDPISIQFTAVTQDESVSGGAPTVSGGAIDNSCFDARITGGQLELRAGRAIPGNGRVYRIMFRAFDDADLSSDGVVTYCVPESPGDICVDDGQYFNSLNCATASVPGSVGEFSLRVARSSGRRVTLRYAIPHDGVVALEVFDVSGRRVGTLTKGPSSAGAHELQWNVQRAGVLFVRLSLDRHQFANTIIVTP